MSLFILGTLGYFFTKEQSSKIFDDYENANHQILQITADALDIPLWNLDEKQAMDQLKALKDGKGFCGARILDKDGNVFTSFNWNDVDLITTSHIDKVDITFTNLNEDNKSDVIGSVEICDNHAPIFAEIEKQNQLFICVILITTLILLVICWLALRIITKPLSKLGDAMSDLKQGLRKISDPALLQESEVGELGIRFNQMIEDLITAQQLLEEKIDEMHLESSKNKLLYSIVSSANEANSDNNATIAGEAIQYALDKCCEFWGWAVGHCYLVDPSDGLLKSSDIWSTKQTKKYEPLINYSENFSFANGDVVIERVLQTGHGIWIDKLDFLGETFTRNKIIQKCGLRSAFCFPIWIGNNVYGVLEFFSQEKMLQNDSSVEFMEAIGRQLGVAIERGRFQKTLGEAKQQAEEANRSKSLFLSNMSHELRTPMHAILNYSEMGTKQLEKGGLERLPKYLNNIQTAGKRLLLMLNDLLDLSKLEAGKMDIVLSLIPIENAVEYALTELDSLLKQKNITATLQKTAANSVIPADRDRMVQVMINLLSNAIKYSPNAGKITITIADNEQQETPFLVISVRNQGSHIPEKDIHRIFEVFAQSDGSKQVGGTGLGLAICREIIHAHNGEIWAENLTGGVAFHIAIPIKKI
jgi:signal transduction histidine kinase